MMTYEVYREKMKDIAVKLSAVKSYASMRALSKEAFAIYEEYTHPKKA